VTTAHRLLIVGTVELVLLTGLGWLPAAHRFPWPGLIVFAAAFIAYAGAALLAGRDRAAPLDARVVWGVAVLMRLALLPLDPLLSDDFYRYLWDGHVQMSGTNPYLFAPSAPEVEGLRTAYHPLINNPDVPTIYPPLAQIVFLFIAAIGSSVTVMKSIWIAADLATGAVLVRVARATGRPEAVVLLLYLWSPLLVVEIAWSGHLESLGLLMLALAILATVRAREKTGGWLPGAAGSALALSALTKFAPAAALPALFRRWGWKAVFGFGATALLLYAPYAIAGDRLFAGLRTYGEHWWFMKGAFGAIEAVTGDPLVARRLAGVLVICVIAWTAFARFDLERALLWVLGTGMILTPTLHPWYVLWMLPMAALRRARPWLLLSGLAFIGYFGLGAYRETGEWLQPGAVRAALWLPFFAVLFMEASQLLSGRAVEREVSA